MLLPEKAAAVYTHVVSYNVILDFFFPILLIDQFRRNDDRHEYDQWKRQVRRYHKKKITDYQRQGYYNNNEKCGITPRLFLILERQYIIGAAVRTGWIRMVTHLSFGGTYNRLPNTFTYSVNSPLVSGLAAASAKIFNFESNRSRI
jgi:hypothetical protein